MADGIIRKDLKGGRVVARFNATGVLRLNAAAAINGCNSAGETVQAMHIEELTWSCGGANGTYFTVNRGGNTVFQCVGAGTKSFAGSGLQIDSAGGEPQANVVATKVNTGPASLIVKMHKRSAVPTSQY